MKLETARKIKTWIDDKKLELMEDGTTFRLNVEDQEVTDLLVNEYGDANDEENQLKDLMQEVVDLAVNSLKASAEKNN